jgi:hypothetical protein
VTAYLCAPTKYLNSTLRCPLVALSGRRWAADQCPLTGVRQTSRSDSEVERPSFLQSDGYSIVARLFVKGDEQFVFFVQTAQTDGGRASARGHRGPPIVRVPFKDGKPEGYYENFAWVRRTVLPL